MPSRLDRSESLAAVGILGKPGLQWKYIHSDSLVLQLAQFTLGHMLAELSKPSNNFL